MGFSRQEYWSRLPFPSPGDLPNPRIETASPISLNSNLTGYPIFLGDKSSTYIQLTSLVKEIKLGEYWRFLLKNTELSVLFSFPHPT